jgi:Holliday junction resolvase-like predicted endonuclease
MGAQVSRRVLAKILVAMRAGEVGLEELREEVGLPEEIFREACALLSSNQVGVWGERSVTFERSDKMKAAILLCSLGEPLEDVSKILSWSEFEDMAYTLLESVGYEVRRRVRLKEPRCEIDVVAAKEDLALVIDCKHWRKTVGQSTMYRIIEAQINRAKSLSTSNLTVIKRCDKLLPVILTLYGERPTVVEGVPIVPINLLSNFITEVRGYLNELNVIKVKQQG